MQTEQHTIASRADVPVPELISVRAVAALLGGCSTRHLYRLVDAGRMPPPLRLGGLVRWRRNDVLEWIAGGCPPVSMSPTKQENHDAR